ncbi:UNVERIFIED_ORG: biotin operon repressor [Rhodococcus erythropolis]
MKSDFIDQLGKEMGGISRAEVLECLDELREAGLVIEIGAKWSKGAWLVPQGTAVMFQ